MRIEETKDLISFAALWDQIIKFRDPAEFLLWDLILLFGLMVLACGSMFNLTAYTSCRRQMAWTGGISCWQGMILMIWACLSRHYCLWQSLAQLYYFFNWSEQHRSFFVFFLDIHMLLLIFLNTPLRVILELSNFEIEVVNKNKVLN